MRIEKINDNIIKVFITYEDLEEREISYDKFTDGAPETQELFWDLIEQAEEELGFDSESTQLCVEAVADSNSGFILTITFLDEDDEFKSIQSFIKERYKKNDLKVKSKTSSICSSIMIYKLESFEDVCTVSKKLVSTYVGESTLYKLDDNYYLVFVNPEINTINETLFESILGEYASSVDNISFFDGYLYERGQLMIDKNAIFVLSKYFN